jgi:hypothetical protein
MHGWRGVDLDGTLAMYDEWRGPTHIGAPVPAMVARVQAWLAAGEDVRIVTARASAEDPTERALVVTMIEAWSHVHVGTILPITDRKDFGMRELWDDRAVQVERNTGRRMDGLPG